jgi:hypothetical protein
MSISAELQKRRAELLNAESKDPLQVFYCSFAAEKFNGAVILKAHGPAHAHLLCCEMGLNPGGEMLAFPIPTEYIPPENFHDRLLSMQEIQLFWPDAKTIREHEAEADARA